MNVCDMGKDFKEPSAETLKYNTDLITEKKAAIKALQEELPNVLKALNELAVHIDFVEKAMKEQNYQVAKNSLNFMLIPVLGIIRESREKVEQHLRTL